ncbi:MAG: DUF3857 domain-containing protein [Ignavibacteriales bacterium]|nr:MAG: DUF3857 domain-containing protein [Ignavibacteriales bacterium]
MFKLTLISILTVLCFYTNLYSQESPIEWGEIPEADLKMTSYAADSNASGLILCDFGESVFDNDLNINFTRHLRIKIFNPSGYDLATHSFILQTYDKQEYLDDLEAITYSLNADNDIVENELEDDDIFEEEIDDSRTRYRFTMPGLTPGCVVDIKYTIITRNFALIRDWIFQYEEPVLWSEYKIRYPVNIAYTAVTSGYELWEINDRTETTQIFSGSAKTYLGSNFTNCYALRWVIKNAPAIREEEYVSAPVDYANKVSIQLSGYSFPGYGYKQVLQNWKTLVNDLVESKYFGQMINSTSAIEEIAKSVTASSSTQLEKMEAIYNWIIKSIVRTGGNRFSADNSPDEILETKKGTNAEISFLMISMLRSLGITADPIVLSTRANGKLQDLYPIISQFNYTMIKAIADGKTYYLDATDPNRPMHVLPSKVLGVKALIVKKDAVEWVNLPANKISSDKIVVNIQLNTDGSITTDIENSFGEYSGLSIRNNLSDKSETDIIKEQFELEKTGLQIDSVNISNKDSINSPLMLKAYLNGQSYSQTAGDMIYLNPVVAYRMTDNPFKFSKRKFPVDFNYLSSRTIVTNVTLPEGYELKDKPENKSVKVGNALVYTRQVNAEGSLIQIITKFEIKEMQVKPQYYEQVKSLFTNMVSTQAELLAIGLKTN